jgi:formylmethanofuran dehydrogenase subunit E
MRLNETLARLEEFHGHLGPYVVVGYRMGELALRLLGAKKYFELKVASKAGTTPPVSCMNDGIQLATGCTYGKGNIKATEEGVPEAAFIQGDRRLKIALLPSTQAAMGEWLRQDGERTAAARVYGLEDDELFQWELTDTE